MVRDALLNLLTLPAVLPVSPITFPVEYDPCQVFFHPNLCLCNVEQIIRQRTMDYES